MNPGRLQQGHSLCAWGTRFTISVQTDNYCSSRSKDNQVALRQNSLLKKQGLKGTNMRQSIPII